MITGDLQLGSLFMKPDEPLYTEIALEMKHAHQFLIPLHHGQASFIKPPLVYWLEEAGLTLFGETIWGARFFIWLLGLASVWLTYRIGKNLFSEEIGLCSAALLFSNVLFFQYIQSDMMDVPLTFFVLWATIAVLRANREQPAWLIWWGLAAGSASLVKGPLGTLLCMVPLVHTLRPEARSLWKTKQAWIGLSLALLTSMMWPMALLAKGYGNSWFQEFIVQENFGKFNGPVMPFKILLIGLFAGFMPWSFLLIESFYNQARAQATSKQSHLLLAWIGGLFLIFGLASRKLPHYVIPAIPACCLIVASTSSFSRFSTWATRIVLGVTGFFFLLGFQLTPSPWVKFVVISGGVAALLSGLILKTRQQLTSSALCFSLLLMTFPVVMPGFEFPTQAEAVRKLSHETIVGVFCPDDHDPRGFEISPRFRSCKNLTEAHELLAQGGVLVYSEHYRKLFMPLSLIPKQEWKIWKSGTGFGEVVHAIWTGNTTPLEEKMTAAKKSL